jgi:hypothetical protein
VVQKLAAAGCSVDVSTLDVADAGEAAQLLADAARAAPVGGIFHLAMVLDDRLIINQARGPGPARGPAAACPGGLLRPRSRP